MKKFNKIKSPKKFNWKLDRKKIIGDVNGKLVRKGSYSLVITLIAIAIIWIIYGIFRKCKKNLWRAFGFALLVLIPVPIAITHISACFLPQAQFDFMSDIFNSGITLALSLVCFGGDYLHCQKKGAAADKK